MSLASLLQNNEVKTWINGRVNIMNCNILNINGTPLVNFEQARFSTTFTFGNGGATTAMITLELQIFGNLVVVTFNRETGFDPDAIVTNVLVADNPIPTIFRPKVNISGIQFYIEKISDNSLKLCELSLTIGGVLTIKQITGGEFENNEPFEIASGGFSFLNQ
jgi:hypothetical protein